MPTEPKKSTTKRADKEYVELRVPKLSKSNNLIVLGLVLLLLALSFFAGSLYTKVKYLEQNGTGTTGSQAAGSSIQETLLKYAKDLKLDENKFKSCLNDEKYAKRVTEQIQEGDKFGVRATPAFFVNGKLIAGAYPYEAFKNVIDKELAGTGSENYLDYIEMLQQAYLDENNRGFEPVAKQISLGDSPVRGDANAKVTIVEYSDFQCPFCQRAISTINQVLADYKGQVKLVYKHYPIISIHPNSQIAAEASECAREQGKFWEYHDKLFNAQAIWSPLPQETI